MMYGVTVAGLLGLGFVLGCVVWALLVSRDERYSTKELAELRRAKTWK